MNPLAIIKQAQRELSGTKWEYLADMTGTPGEVDGWLAVEEYVRRTDKLEPDPYVFDDAKPFRIAAYANACELLGEVPKYNRNEDER